MSSRPLRRSAREHARERQPAVGAGMRATSRSNQESRRSQRSTRWQRDAPTPRRRQARAIAIGQPRLANEVKGTADLATGAIPSWPEPAKLPYDVLLSIFQYATYPLQGENRQATSHVAWLAKVALLRRDFAEPAFAALYYNPPLDPIDRAHRFLKALQDQTERSTIDYRRKVRYLDIDAQHVLSFKYLGHDPPLLAHFLALTPMLRGLRINWPGDDPTMPTLETQIRYSKVASWYGETVYDLLDEQSIILEEWKWNFIFAPRLTYPWTHLSLIHQRPAFRRVRSLEVSRLQNPKEPLLTTLAAALGELSYLEDFTLSSPSLIGDSDILLLFRHVRPLKKLKLLHCDRLDSEILMEVLTTQGIQLQQLTLSHNRALDLGFLASLQSQCPRLESLDMDMTFAPLLSVVRSNHPFYETLLPANCTPTWPRTIRRLNLIHLRKWDTTAATRFFESLVEAATDLNCLRRLEIRMSVDADWKDRISFRDKWEARIPHVFGRRWVEPTRWSAEAASKSLPSSTKTKRSERLRTAAPAGNDSGSNGAMCGQCEHVDVRIDNLRPMERQLDESNFLDAEPSGDEDYLD